MLGGALVIASDAPDDAQSELDGQIDDTAYPSMGEFVRRCGRQTTPEILASHLFLEGRRETQEPSRVERIAYGMFISTLLDLEDLKMTIKLEAERAARAPERVAPTPIEDTIFEPVEDFFTPTW